MGLALSELFAGSLGLEAAGLALSEDFAGSLGLEAAGLTPSEVFAGGLGLEAAGSALSEVFTGSLGLKAVGLALSEVFAGGLGLEAAGLALSAAPFSGLSRFRGVWSAGLEGVMEFASAETAVPSPFSCILRFALDHFIGILASNIAGTVSSCCFMGPLTP